MLKIDAWKMMMLRLLLLLAAEDDDDITADGWLMMTMTMGGVTMQCHVSRFWGITQYKLQCSISSTLLRQVQYYNAL